MITATITSQGQMTIPSLLRKLKNIKRGDEVILEETNDGILIKKMGSIEDLAGMFHDKAFKDKSTKEILKLEKQAIEDGYIERFVKSK
jgi:AbrB family looped-hinge helix DNA binding protein